MLLQELPREVKSALTELKQELQRMYGSRLQGVYLYGSYARGDFHEDSDVDVLVVLEGPVNVSTEASRYSGVVSDICLRYDLLIATIPISDQLLAEGTEPLLDNVRREGVRV